MSGYEATTVRPAPTFDRTTEATPMVTSTTTGARIQTSIRTPVGLVPADRGDTPATRRQEVVVPGARRIGDGSPAGGAPYALVTALPGCLPRRVKPGGRYSPRIEHRHSIPGEACVDRSTGSLALAPAIRDHRETW